METRRSPEEHEVLKNRASIRLEFFRHDEKEKAKEGQAETDVRLTPGGRVHATEVGKTRNPHPEVAIAAGSSRKRSVETAMRHMLANEEVITPESSLEDMREIVAGHVKVGRKDIVDDRLGFRYYGKYGDIALDHFFNKKDILRFAVEESDKLVEELKDMESVSYSRQAADFAEIVKKYLGVLPTWQRIANKDPEKYKSVNNELQRFFGTHQGVIEYFLLKVIEKTEGKQAASEFMKQFPEKNGVAPSQGYTVELVAEGGLTKVTLEFNGRTWDLTHELLDDIIHDRDELNKRIQDSLDQKN